MKSTKEILLGVLKVIGYAGASIIITALIGYFQEVSLTATGITLVIINSIIYILVQISQNFLAKK